MDVVVYNRIKFVKRDLRQFSQSGRVMVVIKVNRLKSSSLRRWLLKSVREFLMRMFHSWVLVLFTPGQIGWFVK